MTKRAEHRLSRSSNLLRKGLSQRVRSTPEKAKPSMVSEITRKA